MTVDKQCVFLPLAATSSNYPVANIAVLPKVDGHTFNILRGNADSVSAFRGQYEFFSSGRYALAEALRRIGVGFGNCVLLPAFHCRSIVEPVLFMGAKTYFYPIKDDLSPDLHILRNIIVQAKPRVLLLTHYFGFPNYPAEIRILCDQYGVVMIEDCAHAFYGKSGMSLLGSIGHYSIASAWKFLPVSDGAMLRANLEECHDPVKASPRRFVDELKSLKYVIDNSVRLDRRLPEINEVMVIDAARALGEKGARFATATQDEKCFDETRVYMAGTRVSSMLIKLISDVHVIRSRRKNYSLWLHGVAGIEGVNALYPKLPESVAPYVFPLLADVQGLMFHALRLIGIPVLRWEDMEKSAVEICPVSSVYRLSLLQLPCHQSLNYDELVWMIEAVRKVAKEIFK